MIVAPLEDRSQHRPEGADGEPRTLIDEIGVVVPAHDEADRIGRCVRSLLRAADHPALHDVRVRVVVVLDSCTDDTRVRAGTADRLELAEVQDRNVGRARSAGFDQLLARAEAPADRHWLATTDADTVVPHDWFARQLAWHRRGADAVAGTVEVVDWRQQGALVRRRFEHLQRDHGTGLGHPHVHGANLGLAASAYLACGGMPALALAEDHALWSALRDARCHTVSAPDVAVRTSARPDGRAPGGFSALLASLRAS